MKRFLLLIIVPILFLLGCNIKNNDYHVAYKGKYSFGFDDSNMTFLVSKCVKSLDELIKLCDDYSNGFYESNSSNYNDEVPKKIRSYDESFFRSNDLIIIVVGKNDAFDYIVHEVEDIDSTIVVKLRKKHFIGIYTDELYSYLILIELEKKENEELVLEITDD